MKIKFIISVVSLIMVLALPAIYIHLCPLSKKDLNMHFAYGAVTYILLRYIVGNPIVNGISLLNNSILNAIASIVVEFLIIFVSYLFVNKKQWNTLLFGIGFSFVFLFTKVTIPLLNNVVYVYQIMQNGVEYYGSTQEIMAIVNMNNTVYVAQIFVSELILICLSNCFNKDTFWFFAIATVIGVNITGLLNGLIVIVLAVVITVIALKNNWVILRGING